MSRSQDFDVATLISSLEDMYSRKENGAKQWRQESETLRELIVQISKKIEYIYLMTKPLAMGGAGIILEVQDLRVPGDTPVFRAMKIPRPIEGVLGSIANEAKHLVNVRHENIIPIHFVDEISMDSSVYAFFVMDLVQNAQDLRKWTELLLDEIGSIKQAESREANPHRRSQLKLREARDREKAVEWFTQASAQVAAAMNYLHKNRIIHFDVKPANVLVDETGKALLADLGYAKSKDPTLESETRIGFTDFYAHPNLLLQATRSRNDKAGDRMYKELRPKDFQEIWDIYAFGKTLLEILNLFERSFKGITTDHYNLNYLHLAACRMLDGRNATRSEIETDRGVHSDRRYYEEWCGLSATDFNEQNSLKYTSFNNISDDLEKVVRKVGIEEQVPELSTSNRKRIQTDVAYPAAFTERVKAVVSHPVFQRLKKVEQLGLNDYVYPTATHKRFEHSLGVYSYTCEYIRGLWYDEGNPLFRQWMTTTDLKALLVASLVHDIGHFPLSHDLEEVPATGGFFDHINLGLKFLDSNLRDSSGRTLRDIIRDDEEGWGVDVNTVREILIATKAQGILHDLIDTSPASKPRFLSTILSGDIDADKLDYLIRDGQACQLLYGESIDVNRIIRTVTTAIFSRPDDMAPGEPEKERRALGIAIYEKGKPAAESIGLVRYLMYQSVYWHHAARSIKVMLQAAVTHVFISKKERSTKTVENSFNKLLGLTDKDGPVLSDNLAVDREQILQFLYAQGDDFSKELVTLIRDRRLYKRIITIHRKTDIRHGDRNVYEEVAKHSSRIQELLGQQLLSSFQEKRDKQIDTLSAPSDEDSELVTEILEKGHGILVDVPSTRYGSELSLCVIPELEYLRKNYEAKMKASHVMADVWREVYGNLMDSICKARVYCHPVIRDPLTSVLNYEDFNEALKKVLSHPGIAVH
jgi:HD superfamily phosphohydrolase